MSDPAIIAALHAKRAELDSQLHHAERRVAQLRADVATLDAALRIFDPANAPAPAQKPA